MVVVGAVDVDVAVEDERRVIIELPNVDPAADDTKTEVDELVTTELGDGPNEDEVLRVGRSDVELKTEEVVQMELMNELPMSTKSVDELKNELSTELDIPELVVAVNVDDVGISTVDVEMNVVVVMAVGTRELATAEMLGIMVSEMADDELRIGIEDELRIEDEELTIDDEGLAIDDEELTVDDEELDTILGATEPELVGKFELNKTLLDG